MNNYCLNYLKIFIFYYFQLFVFDFFKNLFMIINFKIHIFSYSFDKLH
jgi:hypothetical protein